MRNIAVALTKRQIRRQTKDITRRTGWAWLKAGELLQPVEKAQGLRKGQRVRKVGKPIQVISVRRERLDEMLRRPRYGREECRREGFPELDPRTFVAWFADGHGCRPEDTITRIEFRYMTAR